MALARKISRTQGKRLAERLKQSQKDGAPKEEINAALSAVLQWAQKYSMSRSQQLQASDEKSQQPLTKEVSPVDSDIVGAKVQDALRPVNPFIITTR